MFTFRERCSNHSTPNQTANMIRNIIRRLSNPLQGPSTADVEAARRGKYYFTLTNNMVFEVKNNLPAQHIPYTRLLEIVDHVLVLLSFNRIPDDGGKVSLRVQTDTYIVQQVEDQYLTSDHPLLASIGYGGVELAHRVQGSVVNARNWQEDDGPAWPRIQFTLNGMAFVVKNTVRSEELSLERLDQVIKAFKLSTAWDCHVRVGIQLRLLVGLKSRETYTVRNIA